MPASIGFRTSPQNVDWATLEAIWAEAGRHDVFESGWMNDHLTDPARERGGPAFESFTALAAVAHHVPGKTLGHTVLAITFRHPSVLAKQALTMDHVTGGRFVLGLGAGWHRGEHEALGIDLPPARQRFDRFEAQLRVIKALLSDAALVPPGVTLDAGGYRLDDATMEPAPRRPGGPPLWLGGQQRRGLRLAAQYADGWNYPANLDGSVDEFRHRLDELAAACAEAGRDRATLTISTQLTVGADREARNETLRLATGLGRAGAEVIILTIRGASGAEGLRVAASEVALPLREALA